MAWWGVSRWPSNGWRVHMARKYTFSPLHAVPVGSQTTLDCSAGRTQQSAGRDMYAYSSLLLKNCSHKYIYPTPSIALVCSGCRQIGLIISNFPVSDHTPHTWTDFEPFKLNPQDHTQMTHYSWKVLNASVDIILMWSDEATWTVKHNLSKVLDLHQIIKFSLRYEM